MENIWEATIQEGTATVKVDKEDPRAKVHYVKTIYRDGKDMKIWECGLCGKEFRFQYTLMRHIPTHTDVRAFHCETCPKSFRQLSTLAQHRATHLNKRPFFCDICSKSFNRVSTLISHRKIHSDDKRHICHICKKGFHQKGNLRNHIYTHTNARPYKCDICGKGFNQKSNLVCHKSSTHGRKQIFQCGLCPQSFVKLQTYNCHMETTHNVRQPSTNVTSRSDMNVKDDSSLVHQGNANDKPGNLTYELSVIKNADGKDCVIKSSFKNVRRNGVLQPSSSMNDSNSSGGAVLTEVWHRPTVAMMRLHELGQIPFVILYQPGEKYPKICKAVLEEEKYFLVNPTNSDIEKYVIPYNKSLRFHKFPIVSTIIQKVDDNKKLQTLVMPAGLPAILVESSGGYLENGSHTKTPNTSNDRSLGKLHYVFHPEDLRTRENIKVIESSKQALAENPSISLKIETTAYDPQKIKVVVTNDDSTSDCEILKECGPDEIVPVQETIKDTVGQEQMFNGLDNFGFQNIDFSELLNEYNEVHESKSEQTGQRSLEPRVEDTQEYSNLFSMLPQHHRGFTTLDFNDQENFDYDGFSYLESPSEGSFKSEMTKEIAPKREESISICSDYQDPLDISIDCSLPDSIIQDFATNNQLFAEEGSQFLKQNTTHEDTPGRNTIFGERFLLKNQVKYEDSSKCQ